MINSLDDLRAAVRQNYNDCKSGAMIDITEYNGCVQFSYNRECQFKRPEEWNWLERNSRGTILDARTGEIVALPFAKFWNAGEAATPDCALREITVKFDGSLAIIYYRDDHWCVATRGSFASDQALWAANKLKDYDVSKLDPACTYLAEIIYPDNRVVVDYGDMEALVMIGKRNNTTHEDYFRDQWLPDAIAAGFPATGQVSFDSLDAARTAAEVLPANEEGYVCRFADGTRLKVKGGAYRLAHKWISSMTPKSVFDAMLKDQIDDVRSGVPDIYRGLLEQYIGEIETEYNELAARIDGLIASAPADPATDRKAFALWVTASHKPDAPYLFARVDGKPLLAVLYRIRYT